MTRNEAVEMVTSALADGGRSDRWLRMSDDGEYFTTADRTFLGNDGPYTPTAVKIPVSETGTEDEDREWAAALLAELDKALAAE